MGDLPSQSQPRKALSVSSRCTRPAPWRNSSARYTVCGAGLPPSLARLGENLVGADGLMLPPDDLEDPLANRRELELLGRADSLGRGDCALDAAAVVVSRP